MSAALDDRGRFASQAQRWLILACITIVGIATVLMVRAAQADYPSGHAAWIAVFQYAMLAVIVGGLLILTLRRITSRMWWEALLSVTAYIGVWHALVLMRLPIGAVLVMAAVFTLSQFLLRLTALHDLFVLLGTAGMSIALASWVPWDVLAIGLVGFTIYDTVALAPGGAIEALALRLSRFAIVPGIVVPSRARDLGAMLDDLLSPTVHRPPVFLGVGDLLVPLALLAQFSSRSMRDGLVVLGGMLLGACVVIVRRETHPRTLLVPLAAGTLIAVLGLQLFSFVM